MNEALFKTTVMGGFNKGDVLAFVDKQDAQFKAREKELVTRTSKLESDLKAESERSAGLEAKVKELEAALESERSKCSDSLKRTQEAIVETARQKNEYTAEISSRDLEIDKLRQEVLNLTHSLDAAQAQANEARIRAERSEDKLHLIDKTEDQIGRALLEAQQTADHIVNAAKSEASDIAEKAKKEAEEAKENASNRVRLIFCEAKEKLCVLLRGVEDYKRRIEDTRSDVRSFFTSVDTIFASMQNTADEVAEKFAGVFKPDDFTEQKSDDAEMEAAASDKVRFDFTKAEEEAADEE